MKAIIPPSGVRGLIAAAAVTGPAKQPLPASSVPHSNIKLL